MRRTRAALERGWRTASIRARVGWIVLGFFAMAALLGPYLCVDPTAVVAPPLAPPSWAHPFGATGQGQDVLAQTLVGGRTTLLVGLIAGALSVGIGASIGAVAGYVGGWTDDALSVATNVALVLPGLPLAVVLAAWLPAGGTSLVAVLVLTGWAWHARVIRAELLRLRGREWVAAARLGGEGPLRIVFVEVLPNLAPLLRASLVGAVVYALGAQVGLEFLGLGDSSATSWGTNLYWAANDGALLTRSWWTFVPTGLSVALVGFALASIGGGADGGGGVQDTPIRRRLPAAPAARAAREIA